ncbi:hypothetical protein OsccyDRAFT_4244 [Leptolyngbyaceae cyanobacterium JSC-12]|nr:hypothetical protein OsccyDRAFT_4244 [Leptolyngbyaceae cyanobacterium JSC-12]
MDIKLHPFAGFLRRIVNRLSTEDRRLTFL